MMKMGSAACVLVLAYLLNVHGLHQHLEDKNTLSLKSFWHQSYAAGCVSHNSRKEKSSTTLKMMYADFCSGKAIDWNKKFQQNLVFDEARVGALQLRIRNMILGTTEAVSDAQIPLFSGAELQTLNYVVTITIGGRNMTLIVDTGSDLTWIQCQPCNSCYDQQSPIYDPSVSHSYRSVLCNSTTCQSLLAATGYSGVCGDVKTPVCNYFVRYGDGSYTRGELGSEEITLGETKLENFVFGCGRNNKGMFGGSSGLMGLGRSSVSLVSQITKSLGGVFSYCLPSLEKGSPGSLSFGINTVEFKNSTPISFTGLVNNPQLSTFYVLNLTGVSIGGVKLKASGFGKEILIDSGTVVTRLPPSIYQPLKDEFLRQFTGFPSVPGFSILDTCFDLSTLEEVNIPTMRLIFEGNTELEVDVTGMLYFVKTDASHVCLALASLSYQDEIGIIGNYQQRNQRVIYDTQGAKLGFARETCSF